MKVWERSFADDVLELAREILVHVCGESCHKYSGQTSKICRHGFYYIVALADCWRRRRNGKPLRNVLFPVRDTQYGMQGRVLNFQLHPYECVTNYAGIAAFRSNLDVQDLRRVVKQEAWLDADETFPHVGSRPQWGYMNLFELGDGTEYVSRPAVSEEPMAWEEDVSVEQWREILLQCSEQLSDEEEVDEETDRRATELEAETQASFCDGLNTGFYINAYTTKQCPSMEGVLEEMRRGLERLQEQRAEEQAKFFFF